MKIYKNISFLLIPVMMVMSTILMTSCDEDDGQPADSPDGQPSIAYVRVSNPGASDSLLVRADLGAEIVIIGKNLGDTRAVLFNDKQAVLAPTWITNSSIFVAVPSVAPTVKTDQLYLINSIGDTLAYDFEVSIGAPEIYNAKNEWPQADENLVLNGNFFFEPMTVTFEGGAEGVIVSVAQDRLEVEVPAGAVEGPVVVETNFGTTPTNFHIWDSRNIILNFDDKTPNGWRIGTVGAGDGDLDGSYGVFLAPLGANERNEGPGAPAASGFLFEYWGGADADRTEPFYDGPSASFALKFEAKVNNWLGGYLNLCVADVNHNGSNQEIWSNDLNARAIWGPWDEEGASYSTDGWITVVMPFTEFRYSMGQNAAGAVIYEGLKFEEMAVGSLSAWLLGSPENDGTDVSFYVDNFRVVEL